MAVRDSLNDFTESERNTVQAWYNDISQYDQQKSADWQIMLDWIETNAVLQYIAEQNYAEMVAQAQKNYADALEVKNAALQNLADQQAAAMKRLEEAGKHE